MKVKFLELFAETIEAETPLSLEMNLRDLDGWDSLAILSITSMVEDEYGVVIGQKDLKNMVTIGDIVNFITKSMG